MFQMEAEFRSEGGEGPCQKNYLSFFQKRSPRDFFKRGYREVEKTFHQVFFILLYITIYTKLSYFPVNIGYF